MFCFLIFKAIFYILKSIAKTNNAKQSTTKTKIAKFVIKKLVIAKSTIAKYIAQKSIVAKYIIQKSFAIIVQLLNNIYNNIIFNIKNLFYSRTTFIFTLIFNSYNTS